jgi:hypothetical protein
MENYQMKKLAGVVLFVFLLVGCGGAVVHKINFSSDYSPDKIKRLAIVHFRVPDQGSINRDSIGDKFTAALLGSKFKIVDRTDLKKIMGEVEFQNLAEGIIDKKTKEKLHQMGADSVMTGTLQTYIDKRGAENIYLYSEVHLIAKILKVETGEVLWSAEIMKQSKAKNVGQKKIIGGESEAVSAIKLLDDIVSEMTDSFKEKKPLVEKIKFW